MSKRYASWGSDKSYKWKFIAALQDAIFAFKQRYVKKKTSCFSCDKDFEVEDQNDRPEGYFCNDCINYTG